MTPTPTPSPPPLPLPSLPTCTVGVIGLGYVGLPLAACFATTISSERQSHDRTRELSAEELQQALAVPMGSS